MNIFLLNKSQIDSTNRTARLTTAQSHHAKTVLNANINDPIKIGEKGGLMGVGQIVAMSDDGVMVGNIVLDIPPPPKLGVTVVLALPRPKVLRRLVMDMTVMGVDNIIIVNSYRTDKSYWGSPLITRIDEYIHEGLQQGVDTVPPTVLLKKRFKPFVEDELPMLMGDKVLFHPYAGREFGQYCTDKGLPQVVIIGAEGGFIEYEIDLLTAQGVNALSLGNRILRTESAVNAVLGRWLSG